MFKDESVSITQSIKNVKDIGSVFTDFSQSFSVPASKTNNKIFKHYYNYDISELSSFNANDLVSATIELNYRTFRKGFIGLNGTQMKNNKAYAYKITFFGETVSLKNKLKETKLSTVFQGVSTYDHEYNITNVKTGLNSSLSSGAVKYPLISHTERFFFDSGRHIADDRNLHYDESGNGSGSHNHGVRYTDLKPALKVKNIIDEIENYADIEFTKTASDDFFNPSNIVFDNLYLWLSRVKGALGRSVSGSSLVNMPITDIDFSNASPYEWNPESQGTSNSQSPYSRVVDGVWSFRQSSTTVAQHFYYSEFTITTSQQATIHIEALTDGGVYTLATSSGTGTITTSAEHDYMLFFPSTYGVINNVRFRVTSEDPALSYIPTINFGYKTKPHQSSTYTYYNTTVTGNDIQPTTALSNIIISQQMPDIKVIDFLTGLFKMFNLTAYVQNDGKIKVMTLDDFYDSGIDYDITKFVDVNKSDIDFAIPYQEIAFRFQKPNTFLALNFKELFNKTFGDLENTTRDVGAVQTTNRGNKYVVQLPFGKMLYERLNDLNNGSPSEMVYGYCVDKDQNPTNIQPLILSITNTSTGYDESLSFHNGDSNGTAAKLTSYNRPSNTIGTTQSIHFGEEIDEYTKTIEDDSLFENYYKNYIVDTFNQKRRIVNVKAYLPLKILLNYTLADRFIINNRKFKINSVKTNLATGESNIELLNDL
jgi:hypothetical protein